MKTMPILKSLLALTAGSLLATGCVVRERVVVSAPPPPPASGEVVVSSDPPPPITETYGVAPAPGFVWVGGYWAWHGRWVWAHGHWDRPPRAGAYWVGPRYIVRGGVRVYVRGGWRY